MASERQIAANRANALKSTGPRTATGKQISSRNRARHNLLAEAIVLEGESLERFNYLWSSLIERFQPRDVIELSLVESMAVSRWRQMRLWAMEKAGLAHQISKQGDELGAPGTGLTSLDPPTRAVVALRTLSDESRVVDIMGRAENRLDRQFNRAFDRLNQLRNLGPG